VIGNAFARSKAMFAAIMACMTATSSWNQAVSAANVGEYKSRGKGNLVAEDPRQEKLELRQVHAQKLNIHSTN